MGRLPLEPINSANLQTRDLILSEKEVEVIIRSLSDSYNRTKALIYKTTLDGMINYQYTLREGVADGETKY